MYAGGNMAYGFNGGHSVGGLNLAYGQWYYAVVTHGSEFERLYLNGEKVDEWPTSQLVNNGSTMYLGIAGGYGALDDVTVFGRELSPEEVQSLAPPP